jgi:multisubunit Na+/H+ antiporter MnhC subunit
MMLTIGVVFVIWNLVILQSVFWLRVVGLVIGVALVIAGSFIGQTPPELLPARFRSEDAEWALETRFVSTVSVIVGLGVFALVAFRP